jgi:hypothetical protein
MLSFGDSGYGVMRRLEMPPSALAGSPAAGPTVTRVAVPPAEAEGTKAASGKASDAGGGRDGSGRPSASARMATKGPDTYSWQLVYESELKQVFVELVERDSDMVVMRIPSENLARFLRSATDAASGRHRTASVPRLDMVA